MMTPTPGPETDATALATEQIRAGRLEAELESMRLPMPQTARKVARVGLETARSVKRKALKRAGREIVEYPVWTGGRPEGIQRAPVPEPHVYDHIARVL